jgi:hypothetical protein
MGRQIVAGDDSAWSALFEDFTSTAFRWEAQQHYESPEEARALARFCAGTDPGLDLSWEIDTTRGYRAQGKRLSRVRLVLEPASDYVRMALHYLPVLAEAGEDIRVLVERAGSWPAQLPRHDFWVFDDRDVWTMAYDQHGAFLHAEQVDDPALVDAHRAWQRLALDESAPLLTSIAALRRAS